MTQIGVRNYCLECGKKIHSSPIFLGSGSKFVKNVRKETMKVNVIVRQDNTKQSVGFGADPAIQDF